MKNRSVSMSLFASLMFLSAVFLLSVQPAYAAQPVSAASHGHPRLQGTVVDPSGIPVQGVTAKLQRKGSTATTDLSGAFRIAEVPVSSTPLKPEDMFVVEDQGLAFLVLTASAQVRMTVHDFSGRELDRVLDKTLTRGRYSLSPLAGLYRRAPSGIYGVRLQIGPKSYFHRIPFIGEKTRPGLFSEEVPLARLAQVSASELDTLVLAKAGWRTVRQEVLVHGDSLPSMLLLPDSLPHRQTDDPPYLKAASPGVAIVPLLTVGESVPMTGDSTLAYRMGGIPDGLGLGIVDSGTARLFMNHEVSSVDSIHAQVPGPARMGAYVSEYLLDRSTARIRSGRPAYRDVHLSTSLSRLTGAFERLGSGFLGGPAEGLTTPIYLAGEAAGEAAVVDGLTFSKQGPQVMAVVNGAAHLLPDFGKMSFANVVVVPTGNPARTVAFALEDGPSLGSQLYMYVGEKFTDAGSDHVLLRNGLLGGTLHVFAAPKSRDEGAFTAGVLTGSWVDPLRGRARPPQGLYAVSRDQLDAWSRASADGKDSAFNFDRIRDGAYDRDTQGVFYFAATGDPASPRNRFGRLYKLTFDPADPVAGSPPTLEILARGDSAAGFVSPDNLDIGPGGRLVFCEGSHPAVPRPRAVWMLDLSTRGLRKLAEMDVGAVPLASRPDARTMWEASGVIDASSALGAGAWLLNVQAHSVENKAAGALQGVPAGRSLVRGGQLLLLRTAPGFTALRSMP